MSTSQTVEPKLPYSGKFWTFMAPLARHYLKQLYGAELANKADRGGKYEVDADTYDRYAVGDRVPVTTDLTTSHIYEFGA